MLGRRSHAKRTKTMHERCHRGSQLIYLLLAVQREKKQQKKKIKSTERHIHVARILAIKRCSHFRLKFSRRIQRQRQRNRYPMSLAIVYDGSFIGLVVSPITWTRDFLLHVF